MKRLDEEKAETKGRFLSAFTSVDLWIMSVISGRGARQGSALFEEAFGSEDQQRQPDDAKTDQAGVIERFTIQINSAQELQGGRNVLQQAHHAEGGTASPGGKKQEWDG
jgi:hypothetical protein